MRGGIFKIVFLQLNYYATLEEVAYNLENNDKYKLTLLLKRNLYGKKEEKKVF